MSRIEKNEVNDNQSVKMKDEVIKEIRRGKNKKGALSCSILFGAVFSGIIVFILWTVAATGFVRIPVISGFAYKTPAPARLIDPGVPVEVVVEQSVKQVLVERLQDERRLDNTTVSVNIKEASLTASVRSILEQSGIGNIRSASAQVAILQNGQLEFFIPIDNVHKTALTIRVVAFVQDGKIAMTIEDIRLGSLRVPGPIVSSMVQPFLTQQIESLNENTAGIVKLSEIEYKEGALTVTGDFIVEILNP